MEEFLSHEECVQLRDAGFPQPDPALGQIWYIDMYGREWWSAMVCKVDDSLVDVFWIGGEDGLVNLSRFSNAVYVPTALDILKELPVGTMLGRRQGGNVLTWVVETPHSNSTRGRLFRAMAAVNALSAAYLYKEETDDDEKESNRLGYQSERQALVRMANKTNNRNNENL